MCFSVKAPWRLMPQSSPLNLWVAWLSLVGSSHSWEPSHPLQGAMVCRGLSGPAKTCKFGRPLCLERHSAFALDTQVHYGTHCIPMERRYVRPARALSPMQVCVRRLLRDRHAKLLNGSAAGRCSRAAQGKLGQALLVSGLRVGRQLPRASSGSKILQCTSWPVSEPLLCLHCLGGLLRGARPPTPLHLLCPAAPLPASFMVMAVQLHCLSCPSSSSWPKQALPHRERRGCTLWCCPKGLPGKESL